MVSLIIISLLSHVKNGYGTLLHRKLKKNPFKKFLQLNRITLIRLILYLLN